MGGVGSWLTEGLGRGELTEGGGREGKVEGGQTTPSPYDPSEKGI